MKTTRTIRSLRSQGFTLIELLVVISIIAILAGFALPVFSKAQKNGRLSDSLSNCKQITLGMRLVADQNGGAFPVTDTSNAPLTAADGQSNKAFEHMLVGGTTSKKIFLTKGSKWCKTPHVDAAAGESSQLLQMQNDWAYITGLTTTSDSRFPLIMTAPKAVADITYTNDTSAYGGVWGGTECIVGLVDGSAKQYGGTDMILTTPTATFPKNPNDAAKSLFDTGTIGGAVWLSATDNLFTTPLP